MNNKILVIYAHPDTDGYNKEILKTTIDFLKKQKEDYKLIDLYKIKYNPVLKKDELYTIKNKKISISTESKNIQKEINTRNKLIFIYPIWWGTMPSILKGFIEKIFTAGYAYKYVNGIPRGLLKDKKALVITTSGAPDIYNKTTFNKFAKGLTKNVLSFCAIKARSRIIGNANDINKENERDRVKKITLKELTNFL